MRKFLTLITLIALIGCTSATDKEQKPTIYVTITPLKTLAEELTCGDYNVEVLVPKGASPETFEPSAKELTKLHDSEFLFTVGLIDFEKALLTSDCNAIDLSRGITTLAGSCSHHHDHKYAHHSHGVDPHIWTAPRALKQMVNNMRDAVMEAHPDSTKYSQAADEITKRLRFLDRYCNERIHSADSRVMMIYHPAYTYYANDYNIKQIAIETEGKEPSPKQLIALVNMAKRFGVKHIFIQPQYSIDKVETIAHECNCDIIITDPLAEDIEGEIRRITDLITE